MHYVLYKSTGVADVIITRYVNKKDRKSRPSIPMLLIHMLLIHRPWFKLMTSRSWQYTEMPTLTIQPSVTIFLKTEMYCHIILEV